MFIQQILPVYLTVPFLSYLVLYLVNIGSQLQHPFRQETSPTGVHFPPMNLLPRIERHGPSAATAAVSFIFCHGLGDTPDGWLMEFKQSLPSSVRLVLPMAPIRPVTMNMGMSMPSWHDISNLELVGSLHLIDNENLLPECAVRELKESHQALSALVKEEIDQGAQKIILGGFSQGAALSIYTGLRHEASEILGIIALSGYLVAPLGSRVKTTSLPKVLVCHGDADPVVPFSAGHQIHNELTRAGVKSQFEEYNGMGHSSCAQEMKRIGRFVTEFLPEHN